MKEFEDVEIAEFTYGLVKIAVLRGGFHSNNPKAYMDLAVSKYVEHCCYNEFIEEHLDDPWLRVIIKGINEMNFVPFDDQRL